MSYFTENRNISIELGQSLPSFTKSPTSQARQVPSYMMMKRVVDRLLSTGSVHVVISPGRPNAVMTAENRERIGQLVQAKSSLSICGITFQIDIEQTSVWKMLQNVRNHKFK